ESIEGRHEKVPLKDLELRLLLLDFKVSEVFRDNWGRDHDGGLILTQRGDILPCQADKVFAARGGHALNAPDDGLRIKADHSSSSERRLRTYSKASTPSHFPLAARASSWKPSSGVVVARGITLSTRKPMR